MNLFATFSIANTFLLPPTFPAHFILLLRTNFLFMELMLLLEWEIKLYRYPYDAAKSVEW